MFLHAFVLQYLYTKLRIVHYHSRGINPYTIARFLREVDGIVVSRFSVAKFLEVYQSNGSIERCPGSGRLSSVTWRIKGLVEQQMQKDNKATATQLHQMLLEEDIVISLCSVLRCKTNLGWTFWDNAYCQLIRDDSKVKHLHWTRWHMGEEFNDVIFMDETTVHLENHLRFCCWKEGQRPKPKYKYILYLWNSIKAALYS